MPSSPQTRNVTASSTVNFGVNVTVGFVDGLTVSLREGITLDFDVSSKVFLLGHQIQIKRNFLS